MSRLMEFIGGFCMNVFETFMRKPFSRMGRQIHAFTGRIMRKAALNPAGGVDPGCFLQCTGKLASRAGIEPASIEPESIVLSFGPSGHDGLTVFTVPSLYVVRGVISIRTFRKGNHPHSPTGMMSTALMPLGVVKKLLVLFQKRTASLAFVF